MPRSKDVDPEIEQVVVLSKARLLFAQRPTVRTLQRWIKKGLWGVKLRKCWSGGCLCTSREAANQFIRETTVAKESSVR